MILRKRRWERGISVWTRGRKTNRCKDRMRERQTQVKAGGKKDRQTKGRKANRSKDRRRERQTDWKGT